MFLSLSFPLSLKSINISSGEDLKNKNKMKRSKFDIFRVQKAVTLPANLTLTLIPSFGLG